MGAIGQNNFLQRTVAPALAALALLAGGVAADAQYRADVVTDGPEVAGTNPDIVARPNSQLPLDDARFTRSDGVKVNLKDVFRPGKPVILSLVYFSCPMLCGLNQEALKNAVLQGPRSLRLGVDYDIVIVSIDPDDTPATATEKRNNYLKLMDRPATQEGFTYLTGTDDNIKLLADAVGFGYRRNWGLVPGDASGKFAHSTGIFICTPYGHLSQTIKNLDYTGDELHAALLTAADNKIGTGILEEFALPCGAMRLNPLTGHYEHNPWFWAGTAGGAASVGFMAIFLGVLWHGESKRKKLHLDDPPPAPPQAGEPDQSVI